jgi:hypothetical protein
MKFIIAESPNPRIWPVGKVLTLEIAAELLRLKVADITLLCQNAARVREQGFCLEVQKAAREEDGAQMEVVNPEHKVPGPELP